MGVAFVHGHAIRIKVLSSSSALDEAARFTGEIKTVKSVRTNHSFEIVADFLAAASADISGSRDDSMHRVELQRPRCECWSL